MLQDTKKQILPFRLNQSQAMAFCGYKDSRAFNEWVKLNKVPFSFERKCKFFIVDTLKKKMEKLEVVGMEK